MYHTLAQIEYHAFDIDNNWLSVKEIFDSDWHIRYIQSFYWALATIMLVGSSGETFAETIFCCFTLLSTVGIFATILSKI